MFVPFSSSSSSFDPFIDRWDTAGFSDLLTSYSIYFCFANYFLVLSSQFPVVLPSASQLQKSSWPVWLPWELETTDFFILFYFIYFHLICIQQLSVFLLCFRSWFYCKYHNRAYSFLMYFLFGFLSHIFVSPAKYHLNSQSFLLLFELGF